MSVKANQIVAYAQKALSEKWGYVLGGQGEIYSPELAQKWAKTRGKPSSWIGTRYSYFVQACGRWFGHAVTDCSGLIVSAIQSIESDYKDRTANTFYGQSEEKGKIKTMPELPGIFVWKKGHIGVYIGGGYVIEARGYKYGVVKTKVKSRPWTNWGKIRGVDYGAASGGGEPDKYKYTGTGLNIRSTRSILAKNKIGFIHQRDVVEKLGENGAWWAVRFGNITGWCKPNIRYFKKT